MPKYNTYIHTLFMDSKYYLSRNKMKTTFTYDIGDPKTISNMATTSIWIH